MANVERYWAEHRPEPFNWTGRIGRVDYLVAGYLFPSALCVGGLVLVLGFWGHGNIPLKFTALGIFFVAIFLAIIISTFASIKRLHDLQKSGWFYLLNLVPVAQLFLVIYMAFFPSEWDGDNPQPQSRRPNPLHGQTPVKS